MINSVSNQTRVFTASQAAPSAQAAPAQAAPADGFSPSPVECPGLQPGWPGAAPANAQPQPPAQQPPAEQPPAQPAPPQTPPQTPPPTEQPTGKKWTVMVWSASDNNLYRYMQQDLDEAERVGTTEQMNVVAQTDHGPKGGHVVRLEMQNNSTTGVSSPVKQDLGSNDMASPAQLADFIKWTKENYPAQHYALIISDHGAGWQGACHDESAGSWMKIGDVENGLKMAREATGSGIDVLGFDACLMASTEVAAQLKDECSYLVGSQETEGGAGWQYNRVLSEKMLDGQAQALMAVENGDRLNFTPREFAANIVSMAEGNQYDLATMTAIDTSKVDGVTSAVDLLGRTILTSPADKSVFAQAANATQGFYEFKDLVDFAEKAAEKSGDKAVGIAAAAVKAAVSDAIVAEQHSSSYPGAHGLTIELNKQRDLGVAEQEALAQAPAEGGQLTPPNMREGAEKSIDFGKYSATKFAQNTQFDEAVAKFRS